jgi:putative MATE family efflux protein
MSYINPLGEEKISTLLIKFSIPATVGMMVNAFYNIVDRIYIGNSSDLGSNGLAGITLGFPIMLILLSIGVLFGIGGATLFSIRLGEKKDKEAETVLANAFVMLILSGLLYMILGQLFIRQILIAFGANDTTLPYAMAYMRVVFFGAVFQAVSLGMNNFIRADGNPKLAMYTMFLGAGTNIILDPIFIYGFGMGMAGAALATIIAQSFSCTWVVYYFLGKHSRVKLKKSAMKLQRKISLKIIELGMPGFLMQLANSLLNIVLNKSLINYGGDVAISAMGIINSVQTLILMPVIGIRQGTSPIVGFNFGAKKYKRVKEAVKYAIIAGTIIVSIFYILIQLFPRHLIGMFNREAELLAFGEGAVRIWFFLVPFVAFQLIGSYFFQSIGRARVATFLTLSRQVIFLIPAILIFPRFWGLEGLLFAAPFADLCSVVVTAIMFTKTIREFNDDEPDDSNLEKLPSV